MSVDVSWVALINLLVGVMLLYFGSELLILGASAVATRFGIPQFIVGITIVAYGTSLPEFFVSLVSLLRGEQELIIGNILGSNLFNLAFILPIFIFLERKEKLLVQDNKLIRIDLPVMALAGPLAFMVLYLGRPGTVGRLDGLILLSVFCIYVIVRVVPEIRNNKNLKGRGEKKKGMSNLACILAIISGGFLLWFGGNWVVKGAVMLAEKVFHVSRHVIGATIVACSTSLPELFTSIVALIRKKHGLSLGNIIGSNIVNIFFILALTGIIIPISSTSLLLFDVIMVCLSGGVVWLLVRLMHRIPRFLAPILLLLFGIYMAYLLLPSQIVLNYS